jgi:prepilin-type N-terminal cleavage/methylation domain-containing protein
MSDRRRRRRRRAFTLVELLVVIGIIALLIAILMPALRRARDQANRTACMSNMRQIVTAFMLYAGENKDRCPYGARLDNPGNVDLASDWVHWRSGINNQRVNSSAIAKYVGARGEKLEQLLRCPSDVWQDRTGYRFSYSMNMYFEPRAGYYPAEGGPPIKLGSVKRASDKILLAEENEKTINDGFWAAGNYTASPPSINNWVVNWDWLSLRHDDYQKEAEPAKPNTGSLANLPNRKSRGVVACADGHVEFLGREQAHHPSRLLPRY